MCGLCRCLGGRVTCHVRVVFFLSILIISAVCLLYFSFSHDAPDPTTEEPVAVNVSLPTIVWWTGFTKEPGQLKQCGDVSCFFTVKREYLNDYSTRAFIFYGTDFDLADLPLPRKPQHSWALVHEESPQNNWLFSNELVMGLFNYTSTFKRSSDYPITLHALEGLHPLSGKYVMPVKQKNRLMKEKGLAPIAFVQRDCRPPSDRDSLVTMLQRYIPVDSYGECLHNKDFPDREIGGGLEAMNHRKFFKLLAQYKFLLSVENAVCDDYITEKFWRPFYLGAVPIVYGSPTAKDFLPSTKSAILVQDYDTVADLAAAIQKLNENDALYEEYVAYKKDGMTNPRLRTILNDLDPHQPPGHSYHMTFGEAITGFECYVCQKVWKRMLNASVPAQTATIDHYGCPKPRKFGDKDHLHKGPQSTSWFWSQAYEHAQKSANIFFSKL